MERNYINLLAAISAIVVLGFAMGLTFPLISLRLESQGYSASMIGLSAASQPIGTVIAVFFTSRWAQRLGERNLGLVCALGTAAILVAFPLLPNFWIWCGLRVLQGLMFSALFAISEAWIVAFSPPTYRTRILSLYMSAFSGSLALGPMLVAWLGSQGAFPFVIGALALLVAAIPVSAVQASNHFEVPENMNTTRFISQNKLIIAAVASFALTEISMLGLLPIFGLEAGLPESHAALLASAFVAGPMVLQFPIGWLADMLPKWQALLGSAVASALLCLSLPLFVTSWVVWPVLILLGTTAASLYTVSLAMLGEKYRGSELVTGTAVISAVYGAGSFIGSTAVGSSMNMGGPKALPIALTMVLATMAFLAFAGRRGR